MWTSATGSSLPLEAIEEKEKKPLAFVLDEEKNSRQTIALCLESKGFKVIATDSPQHIKSLAPKICPSASLIIVSTTFPACDGCLNTSPSSHIGGLLAAFPMVPALMLGEEQPLAPCERAAAVFRVDRLDRPVDPKTLDAGIERCMDLHRSIQYAFASIQFRDPLRFVAEPISRILHDINNHLVGLKGGSDLIAMTTQHIQDEATHAEISRFIEQFIRPSLAKIEGMIASWRSLCGETPLQEETTDLIESTRRGIAMAALPYHCEAISLSIKGEKVSHVNPTDSEKTIPVRTSPRELAEAIAHCVRNALEAMDGMAAANVAVEIDDCPDHKDASEVRIFDNGPGIPQDQTVDMWRSFSSARGGPRSGMGLSLCKQIADKHGGQIQQIPSPLGGAGFRIVVPHPIP